MDLSTENHQQQHQLQQYHQEHQPQQPQQAYNYDPSYAQAYDAYYASYYQQQYQQQYYQTPQQDPNPAYYDSYYAPQYAPPPLPATATTTEEPPHQGEGPYRAPPGLNPAAAAAVEALSQLTQFAGSMDAAERAAAGVNGRQWGGAAAAHRPVAPPSVSVRPSVGRSQSQSRGRGKRGGGPFRGGGGRGNFGHHHSQPNSVVSPSRGRGRGGRMGRGGGRRFPQSHPEVPSPYPAVVPYAEPSYAPAQTHASIPPMPIRQPPVVARCDICKVDCNSLEILDQHKNGKRHKKNLQRFEEIQKHQRLIVESQARYAPISAITAAPSPTVNSATPTTISVAINTAITSSNEQQPPSEPPVAQAGVGENEENCALPIADNLPAAVAADENNPPNQQETEAASAQLEPIQADLSENLPPQQRQKNSIRPPRNDGHDRKSFPMKRQMMMMGGRGGKRFRGPMGASRPMPPERPREPHRICTLCNVLCESLQVFESHLAGKKHASNVKRYEGQGLVYGQMSHYLPPNQLPPAYVPHASYQQPIFYGLQSQEMTQQVYVPQIGISEPQAQQDHGQTQEGILGAQSQQDQMETQLEGTLPEDSAAEVNMVLENTETKPDGVSKTEDLVHASSDEPAVTESNIKVEGPVTNMEMPVSDMVSAIEDELAFTGTIASLECNTELEVPASDMVPVPEYGLDQMWDIVLPGLEPKVEEPATNAETAALHVDEYALDLKEPDLVTEVVDQDTSLI